MRGLLLLLSMAFSVGALANPFSHFSGDYTVDGNISVTRWNFSGKFPDCKLWNAHKAKKIQFSKDPIRPDVYRLGINDGSGMKFVEKLGDFSCGGSCYYETGSDSNQILADGVYVPNGQKSSYQRGVIVNESQGGVELFIADVSFDETGGKNGYCYYEMNLIKQ